MKIRFAPFIGIFHLAMAATLVIVVLWAQSKGVDVDEVQRKSDSPMQNVYVLVPLFVILALLSLLMPYGVYKDNHFFVKNSIGMTRREIFVGPITNIVEEKGKLYVEREGKPRQRIRITKLWSHKGDWNKLLEAADKDAISKELHDVS